jgi:hypothetical protein
MRIRSRLLELPICGWGAMGRALHYALPKRHRCTSENDLCTSAQLLGQPRLYLRLLTHRGGEAALQGVVRLTITREVRAAFGLGF